MISETQMKNVLDEALSSGGDFAELFFEDREETNINSRDGSVQGVRKSRTCGTGLTVLSGTKRVYVYSSRADYDSLMRLAGQGASLLEAGENASRLSAALPVRKEFPFSGSVQIYPGEVASSAKIRVLTQADRAARSGEIRPSQLNISYFDNDQRIFVANSDGLLTADRRVSSRMRFQFALSDGKSSYYDWEDYTRGKGFETFADMEECEAFAADLIRRGEKIWRAPGAPACHVPVVLAAGACGTLWHECVGHGLEASAIASGNSIYVGKIGQKIASGRVTLIDDGTLPGQYGSSAIDDEGRPRQRNVLIEHGVLKQYLCDRLHGRMIGRESNGCGRKQNYTYAATSRMSNTFLAAGEDDEEEIIRSVPEGLFVKSMGGGSGGQTFTLSVKEGFWIKNGAIDHQVKGLMLSGNGIETMQRVDRVGKLLVMGGEGFCGADSGLVPTTTSQPMVRISEMAVSGQGGAS